MIGNRVYIPIFEIRLVYIIKIRLNLNSQTTPYLIFFDQSISVKSVVYILFS